jgi:hypothetical protein
MAVSAVPATATAPTGKYVVIGMPFNGAWGSSSTGNPATHLDNTYPNGSPWGQWAQDFFAFNTDAYLRATAPNGGSPSFTFNRNYNGCASTGVILNVLMDGSKIGEVYYDHLDDGLSLAAGTNVTIGRKLGTTRNTGINVSPCYYPGGNAGVHTHFEARNTSGYSCWMSYTIGTTLNSGDAVGVVGATNATASKQACDFTPPSSSGSVASSPPSSAVSAFNSTEKVFARGVNNEIYINTWSGSSWSGFTTLQTGAVFAGNPTAVQFGSALGVYARGVNNEIYGNSWNGTNWTGFTSLQTGATFASDPVAVQFDSTTLNIFARGTDNQLYENTWNGTAWTGFQLLQAGAVFVGNPTAIKFGAKEYVFARGIDNQLYVNTWTSGSSWSGFTSLQTSATFAGDPVVFQFGNVLNVFARGIDNQLYGNWLDTSWHSFSLLQSGAYFISDPSVAKFGTEEKIFARGTDNQLYENTWNGTAWTGFGSLQSDAVFSGDPVAIQFGNVLNVFARGTDNQLYEITKNPSWGTFVVLQAGAVFNGFS